VALTQRRIRWKEGGGSRRAGGGVLCSASFLSFLEFLGGETTRPQREEDESGVDGMDS
jgi:hypothetical protein